MPSESRSSGPGFRFLFGRRRFQSDRPGNSDFTGEIVVVGDDQQSAAIIADRAGQDRKARKVEVVGRLVEDKEIGNVVGDHQAAEAEPHPFAAAQRIAPLVPHLLPKQRTVKPQFQFVVLQIAVIAALRQFQHALRGVHTAVLLIETDIREVSPADASGSGFQFAGQQPDEGRFARAVVAGQADTFAAADLQRKRFAPQRAAGRIFEIQAVGPDQQFVVVKLRVVEIYFQLALRPLPAAQFVQPLPTAVDQLRMFPDELRLGPFAAVLHRPAQDARKLVLVPLALTHPPLLSLADLLRLFAGQPQGRLFGIDLLGQRLLLDPFAFAVKIIVAAVDFQSFRREFAGRAEQVEQRDVVAHNDDRRAAGTDQVIEPAAARRVEVIGRFVEQNDGGVMDRNPRQTEFRPLAAAQRIDRVGQADVRQSPVVEGGAAAGFDVPIVGQNVVTAGIGAAAADGAERIELVRDAQNADGGDAGGGEVLRHIVGTRGAGDASRGGSEFARDKFKERRFAGAVVAHDGSFGARGDGQVYSFEQKLLIAVAVRNTAKDNTHMKTINSGPAEWGPVKPQTGLLYGTASV